MGTGVSTEEVPELCWIKVTPTQAPSWKWKVCSDVLQMKGGERGKKERERKKKIKISGYTVVCCKIQPVCS